MGNNRSNDKKPENPVPSESSLDNSSNDALGDALNAFLNDLDSETENLAESTKPDVAPQSNVNVVRRDAADINVCPESPQGELDYNVATIGDIHANTLKFFHMLKREGVINISEDHYNNFRDFYYKGFNDVDASHKFTNALGAMERRENGASIRLIGDDVADRGYNDAYTFYVYEQLAMLNIPYEIIASNHGVEFLKQYANGLGSELTQNFVYQGAQASFGNSLHQMREYLADKAFAERIDEIITKYYIPNIKLLSYDVVSNSEINIYSHGPISEEKVKSLTELFQVEFNADSPAELGKTIDRINLAFKEIASDKEKLKEFLASQGGGSVFDNFVNDRYDSLKVIEQSAMPVRDYSVNNIHGHVGEVEDIPILNNKWQYINLDSNLGKTNAHNMHYYDAMHAQENNPEFVLTPPTKTLGSTAAILAVTGVGKSQVADANKENVVNKNNVGDLDDIQKQLQNPAKKSLDERKHQPIDVNEEDGGGHTPRLGSSGG